MTEAPPESIVVLCGGTSPERTISLQSGDAVARSFRELGYTVDVLDPQQQPLQEFRWKPDSMAIVMLHGTYGEDGQVQSELEALGVPYSGSGINASRLAFHKDLSKQLFQQSELPTPPWETISSGIDSTTLRSIASEMGFPLVVKPEAQGSSIGVAILHDEDELWKAFQSAGELDSQIILERAILGSEWTVPVLDNFPLPPIRIGSKRLFFDYQAKYHDHQTSYDVIDPQSSELAATVSELGLKACQSLETEGICRVDIMVDQNNQPWLLEVNTIPGMTNHSLVPKSAASLGWNLNELCERILFSALSNHSSRKTDRSSDD